MAGPKAPQALTAALQACGGDASPTSDPTAARVALGAADVAAQALLRLAADPGQHAATLDGAVSAITPWLKALEGRLDRWEAALGPQPPGPKKSTLEGPFRAVEMMVPPPPPPRPGAHRRPGATAGPERCAARLQAAGVLTLVDAALACLQARLPPPAAERGARDVPPEPTVFEVAAFAVLRRLEDTGLPYPVRPAAGRDAAQAGQATAAGIRALGTCCSVLTRLLKLVSRRDHAQPEQQGGGADAAAAAAATAAAAAAASGILFQPGRDSLFGSGEDPTWVAQLQTKCRPVQLDAAMDTLYDASAVLTFWTPNPGKLPGREHQAAWDACIALIQHLWCPNETPRLVSGELLSRAARRYGGSLGRYVALSPVLAYHAMLCARASELRSAPPAELEAWAAAMHRVLSLLTDPLLSRVKGVVMGSCVGGPASSFDSLGRCELLTRSAAVLRLLPSLAAAAAGIPADGAAGSEAGGGGAAGGGAVGSEAGQESVLDTEQRVLEVGQMLVQLLSSCCSSFNPDVREKARKGDYWWDTSLPHIRRAYVALGLELLPSLVAPPLAVLSASGPAFAAAAHRALYGCSGSWGAAEAGEAGVHKWQEWQAALHDLCGLAWSLGEEVEAGARGSPYGNCRTGADRISTHVPFATTDVAAVDAEDAVQASGAWPPREPAVLAAAAAAAEHLLGRWHSIRAALLPPPPAGSDASFDDRSLARMSRTTLRLQQRLPHTCRQLVAAAAAALERSSPAQLQAALMPLLDAASTACKLLLLACSDAAHRALLGIAEAAPANDAPDICPPCRPYRPIELMVTACQAAAGCVRRLLAHPSALPPEHQEYARRRTRALLLQLCAASEAASKAGEPLASRVAAAWGSSDGSSGLRHRLSALLEACGSVQSGVPVALSGSLPEGLAAARTLAGSEGQQQLALATLPCANAACTAAGAGGSEAALPGKRCGGCSTHRYSSTLCQQAAWRAGHRQCCRSLAAEAAAAPPAAPPPYGGEVPRKRERALLCPLCGMGLALAAAAEGVTSEDHLASCLRRRDDQLAAQRAQHGGDVVAAAAALPEVAWLRRSRREQQEERARLAAEARLARDARAQQR